VHRACARPPLVSVALICAAALAYEVLLMRLLSIAHWHHFAYMIISVALLGYGVSGTVLTLLQERLKDHFPIAFIGNAALFGLTSVGGFVTAQALPFNALELLWDFRQPLWLLLIYLLLFIPFFCAANCVCLAFAQFPGQLHRIYSFDLLGAAAGAMGIIGLLFLVMPGSALQLIGALGMLTAWIAMLECRQGPRSLRLTLLLAAAVLALPHLAPDLKVSQFKGLELAKGVIGAEQIDQRSSPLGLLSTVANNTVPFRHAPGLSLNATTDPPRQLAVFSDADGLSVISRYQGELRSLAHLDQVSSALPYHLLRQPRVLVLGAGGGTDILQALYHGARSVDAVELNPQMVRLVDETFGDFSGRVYTHPRVRTHIGDARGFISGAPGRYDLVQLALFDSFGASSAGLHALSENYLYTVEALGLLLASLKPDGILAITRWVKLPPRDGIKMFATAAAALEREGVIDPGRQMLMIRSWNTSTLLVGRQAFSGAQIESLRNFCVQRWFDLIHYPGMQADEANRYNQLQQAWYFEAARRILDSGKARFFDEYKFDVRPATDDQPYFFNFLKWQTLPEILSLRARGGLPLLEQGYLILVITLAQAAISSLVLILLPLWVFRIRRRKPPRERWRIAGYFFTIGLSFMLIEIAFIQKFILFLSHPLYAAAVVLSAFLMFAGLGSALSGRVTRGLAIKGPVAGIALIAMAYLLLLPSLFQWLMPLHDLLKIVVTALLIAPLAFLMGIPFPLGLSRLEGHSRSLIPWAWGINGCASVLSAVLAAVLAIHAGFTVVVLLALCLYAVAAACLPGKA
jgi:hypothetical protein